MKKIRIGQSPLSNNIYAGTVTKEGFWRTGKQDVTIDALVAVAQHAHQFGKPIEIRTEDGTLEYRITVEKFNKELENMNE